LIYFNGKVSNMLPQNAATTVLMWAVLRAIPAIFIPARNRRQNGNWYRRCLPVVFDA